LHTASMPNVLIRNLNPEVHATLARRAAEAGQSLQQYVTEQLTIIAGRPTMAEVIDRIETRLARGGGVSEGAADTVEIIHQERDAHDDAKFGHRLDGE